MNRKKRILTGDRPSGKLHLGHYVGSLQNRVRLQNEYDQFIIIADVQALTDNFENPEKVRESVFELIADYIAVGLDPKISTIYIQSQLSESAELTIYLMNLITINRLQHNPTVKAELRSKDFEGGVPAGFLCYPISQAADIAIFGADCVPVGEDQLPVIEEARHLVRRFNEIYRTDVLVLPEALLSHQSRLAGLDGKEKMSKSKGNAIYLSDSRAEIVAKVKKAITGQTRTSMQEPGVVEGNVVFTYLDAFMRDKEELAKIKERYAFGGVGDGAMKELLIEELEAFLSPIRARRPDPVKDRAELLAILKDGTERARAEAAKTLARVKAAMKIDYFA